MVASEQPHCSGILQIHGYTAANTVFSPTLPGSMTESFPKTFTPANGSANVDSKAPVMRLKQCLFVLLAILPTSFAHAGDAAIEFDVPAMLPVVEVIAAGVPPVTNYKIIEIVIPVTAEIRPRDRDHVDEFRLDVSWSRHAFPVADYGPKSQMVSHIAGNITVDSTDDSTAGVGLTGSSEKLEFATITGNANLSNHTSQRKSYQEIPQHRPVIASGTINRGTGAFFRFHCSRTETLEGGRDVVVAYRVSRDWRGGVLKVQCRALGQRKIFGAIPDDIDVGKAFMVPVYLEGDSDARVLATDFVTAEQSLRRNWLRHSHSRTKTGSDILLAGFNPFAQTPALGDQWLHELIQSGDDRVLREINGQLPKSTSALAAEFVSRRARLMELCR